MSGIALAAAAATTPAPPPPPFTATFDWVGQNPMPVSGGSGVAQSVYQPIFYPNVFSVSSSGGTPPYTSSAITLSNNPSGKLSLATRSDGVHVTIAWTGLAINEIESTDVSITMMDSGGASKHFTTSVTVQRTS